MTRLLRTRVAQAVATLGTLLLLVLPTVQTSKWG
jgi:hypothetical protein